MTMTMTMTVTMTPSKLVVPFAEIGADDLARVGGKGANLGVLSSAGLPVPGGFCLTTTAYRRFVASAPDYPRLVAELETIDADDVDAVRRIGGELREHLCSLAMPEAIHSALLEAWRAEGEELAYAVRSSATAEDLPDASFAGQQDTYLNIIGAEPLARQVQACWASLYTDRAILYRRKNGIPHDETSLSVVVQRMIQPAKAGILFTADPVTGHRRRTVVDAGFGLGEALVSGRVNADLYRVDRRTGELLECRVGDKHLAIVSLPGGGTEERLLSPEERAARVLDERELATLVDLGEQVERLYGGAPQDIEWCITAAGEAFLLQARPITTLYPLMKPEPEPAPAPEDGSLQLGFSIGHAQMMIDPMKPMGISTIRQVLPVGRRMDEPGECPWLRTAGGRLYLDISQLLRFAPTRKVLLGLMPSVDALAAKAVATIVERPEFAEGPRAGVDRVGRFFRFMLGNVAAWLSFRDPEGIVDEFSRQIDEHLAGVKSRINTERALPERLRVCVLELGTTLHKVIHIMPSVGAGMVAGELLRKLCPGYEAEIGALSRGLHGNVTTAMDLDVGDLADIARRHPPIRSALASGLYDLDQLRGLAGGDEFIAALGRFLDRYGMRGPGEFDITRPRWGEAPASLLSMVAGNLGHEEPGAHREHHQNLQAEAKRAAERLSQLSWGPKRALIRRMVRLHQTLPAGREHPKYFLVRVMAEVRAQLLAAGAQLLSEGRLDRADDVFFLDLHELIAAVEESSIELRATVEARAEAYRRDHDRSPPRVMTSEGEIPQVSHNADVPAGALAGSGVSSGVVEGIVRVVTDPVGHVLEKGEILVAPFTDPGWTPLFINAAGVVIEVGGMMTHGSVIAREYGIPAVVSVPHATTLLRTGQRILVNGDEGWAMVLDDADENIRAATTAQEKRSSAD